MIVAQNEQPAWTREEQEFLIFAIEFTNRGYQSLTDTLEVLNTDHLIYRDYDMVKEFIEDFLSKPWGMTRLTLEILEAKRTNTRLREVTARRARYYLAYYYVDADLTYRHLWH